MGPERFGFLWHRPRGHGLLLTFWTSQATTLKQIKAVTTAPPTLSDRVAVESESMRSDIRDTYHIPIMARIVPKPWIGPDLFRHGIGGHGFKASRASLSRRPLVGLMQDQEPGAVNQRRRARCGG
jgi:hypothetical protein